MNVVGSCILRLVFSPVGRIFCVAARVVEGLPYAVGLKVALMLKHRSIVSFGERLVFRSSPNLPWIPFSPLATQAATASKAFSAMGGTFCAVYLPAPGDERESSPVKTEIPCCLQVPDNETLDGIVTMLHSETSGRKEFNT